MNLKLLAFLSAALIFSQQVAATGKSKADRWFEMEVILFSQLGDKTELKEQFPENSPLPKYSKIIDLIGPYLTPDITSLKQKLPSCDAPNYPESLLNQAITKIKEQAYYQGKSLTELEETITKTVADTATGYSKPQFSDGTNTLSNLEPIENRSLQNNTLEQEDNLQLNNIESQVTVETPKQLSIEELEKRAKLLAQAELEFSAIQLSYSNETASFSKHICSISVDQFNQFNQSSSGNVFEHYNAFNIEKMPDTINNNEDIYSDNDYLLNENSLKLHDIVKQLARSKNFKPLLHFGWRQKTKTKKLAVPMKVYAGENFAYHYQQELLKYQQQLMQAQESTLNNALYDYNQATSVLSEQALKQRAITERLQELIGKVPNLPTDTVDLLEEINKDIANTQAILHSTNVLTAPVKPPQDWTIDGFLKVEVDFYLHITADLNVMNMSLGQLATQQLLPESEEHDSARLKTIKFTQDRRVRSKEIHYFDHPYMGMIIRILPYKKPTIEIE